VIEKIDRLNCPTWQKLELLQAVIDTTKGTYKPKEHQKRGDGRRRRHLKRADRPARLVGVHAASFQTDDRETEQVRRPVHLAVFVQKVRPAAVRHKIQDARKD